MKFKERAVVMMALFCLGLFLAMPVIAQDQDSDRKVDTPAGEMDVTPLETGREMTDYPLVKLRSLDKITARTVTFEAEVGSTLKFGPIFIKVQACREPSPLEESESASFLQIWEVTPEDEAKWIFSGWMFASSPGLSAMDHPIYDVWVLDCMETADVNVVAEPEALGADEGIVDDAQVPAKPDGAL